MKNIRIGTRKSPLAMWQAQAVADKLQEKGHTTEIIPIISSGDKNLNQPLYEMGITGVFTRDLDIALLNNQIDIAVHSLKDVPTQLPNDIELIAFLERDYPKDVLVRSTSAKDKPLEELKIATSSLRRRAFWSKNFPNTVYYDIRGNVHTRLQKLETEEFDATMFSLAGIKRMKMDIEFEEIPDFISAPAQGVVAIAGHKNNVEINNCVKEINHLKTNICIQIERDFLSALEGGCTAPIGALAEVYDEEVKFLGRLCSLDGKQCIEVNETFDIDNVDKIGQYLAKKVLNDGGDKLMSEIKAQL